MTIALALSIFVFLTIVVIVFAFGAATVAPSSVLGSRLREIGWQRPKTQAKPAMRERMQQALDPFSRALPVSPAGVSQTRAWLIQAGYRSPQHVTIYNGLRVEDAQTVVDGDVLRAAISGLDEPGAGLGDSGGGDGQGSAEGIERLLHAFAHGGLGLGFGALPADFAEAGSEDGGGRNGGGSEGEDDDHDGQENENGECQRDGHELGLTTSSSQLLVLSSQ